MKIADLKKSMDARFGEMDARFGEIDVRLAAVDSRFDALEARMVVWVETIRRHFDIVAEQLRADMKLMYDKLTASHEELAGLTARNSQDHAGFAQIFDNHEVRIQTLERKSN